MATDYNPIIGDPDDALGRIEVATPLADMPRAFVPVTMVDDPRYPTVLANPQAWQRLRCYHDFEYWAARCVTIKHKISGADVPLVLNKPQRLVARKFEAVRRRGLPVRAILLKARQWGGSTLVLAYMAWIQSCRQRNWHSIICSQVKDTSSTIRGMYSKILQNYPADLWDGDAGPAFKPFERSENVREIVGRGCRVTVASIENQDAVRGADYAMAHLSEVAFWRSTPSRSPEDVLRAICGSVPLIPDSFVAIESTANGVGNFFHREWLRSCAGVEGRIAIFVPWMDIDYYRVDPPADVHVMDTLSDYERSLADMGCDEAQIYWYRLKLAELGSPDKMMAEFPSTAEEAFIATGASVFERDKVEALRAGCSAPDMVNGVCVWRNPEPHAHYVVAVDIGGSNPRADFSVIVVVRADSPRPEVVAQWRGHIYHDLLAYKAMEIGRRYNDALLVVESNSLEGGAAGGHGMYILDLMANSYPNIYRRQVYDDALGTSSSRIGFHTNRATKAMIISGLIAKVRTAAYIEHDSAACDELLSYEHTPDGSYAAALGSHDDLLMARAIALSVIDHLTFPPLIDPASLNIPFW